MKISIVIPVINEADHVRQAIGRAWKSGADQVVVVDGGSSDHTNTIVGEAECLFVISRPGRAIQMNRGAAESDGDVLVFLHADNWLAENACEQIRAALEKSQHQFGAFRQKIDSAHVVYRWIEYGNQLRVKWQGLIYGDQSFFIERELFDQVGGFPEIELMEDFELSKCLRPMGKPVLLPGPTFVSPRRWEKAGLIRQTVRNWFLTLSYRLGASPKWLAARYRRHDK